MYNTKVRSRHLRCNRFLVCVRLTSVDAKSCGSCSTRYSIVEKSRPCNLLQTELRIPDVPPVLILAHWRRFVLKERGKLCSDIVWTFLTNFMQHCFHIDISFYLVLKVVNKYSCAVAELELDSILEDLKFLSTILRLLLMLLICLSNTYYPGWTDCLGPYHIPIRHDFAADVKD